MQTIILLSLFLIVSVSGYSQKKMSLEDAVTGRYTNLRPERPTALQWKDAGSYVFASHDTLWSKPVGKGRPEVIMSLTEMNRAAKKTGISFSGFPSVSYTAAGFLQISRPDRLMLFDPAKKEFTLTLSIPADAENPDFCEQTNTLAYVRGQNLYILGAEGEKQITFENKPGIVCGKEVHRQEFGITKGTFWSATGKYLAFYRKDESMVRDYPLVDFMTREAEYTPVKYPMAGMTSHQVQIGIYDRENGKTHYLNTGAPDDHYLTNISWAPDDQHIYVAELNRAQNRMHLNQYLAATGEKTKTIMEETSASYVEPVHPIIFSKADPDQFFYWSRKDGWFHLYLYNTDGKLIRQVTKGDWEVTDFYGTDAKGKTLYIQSTMESPVERHIYKVEIAGGEIRKLTTEPGTHAAIFSPGMDLFIDRWEAGDVPSATDLINNEGKLVTSIHRANDPLADYVLGKNEIFTVKAADNRTDLYCRLILPSHFDPGKKYPVVVYVYGGPHAQLINNTWHHAADWWQYYMAEQGYLVFTMDNRGSDNRGKAFEEVIHRRLGINETADQMKGVEYLKSLPYVDPNRLGVFGWSYGGFMALNLKLRQGGDFKVAIAGGPVVDWKMYEVMYGERYMDLPEENPQGYEASNMISHVSKLTGKLMLIHGVQDETVVMQHSMLFLNECIKENKQVDFFPYPTHPHNVRGKDRLHLMTKISQYFFDNL